YESENYEIAIIYFDESLTNLPESPLLFENLFEIYFYRGNSYSSLNKPEFAIQDYNKAFQFNQQNEHLYYNRGNAYGDLGEYERAIQDYD
ncbi:MAG TPA: hypothetical protein DHW49_09120, partial [Anaerolineae bacterium]|nr:hypothetical protein [Anaerolineae bacterium]